jgi:Family of unknown function (DUF6515)
MMITKTSAVKVRQLMMLGLLTLTLVGAGGVAGAQDRDHRADHPAAHAAGPRDHTVGRGPVARGPAVRGPAGHDFFDNRYDHARYYPPRGAFVRALPGGYRSYYFRGRPYFFVGGAWYINGPDGFIVSAPPAGLVVSVLPPFYTTVWIGGAPYYYADDVYYQWDPGLSAYQVVAPPAGADQPGPPVQTPAAPSGEEQLYIYPKNGQTQAQQAQDRYECHSWASDQTGFDPTQPGGGVSPDQNAAKGTQYRRAMTACLEARGYSVD